MSIPLLRYKRLDRGALIAELGGSRLASIISYVESQTNSTLGGTVTQGNAQTCFNNIYGTAIESGYSTQQAAQIAGVAVAAYTAEMAASGATQAMAQQAATAAAVTKVMVIAAYEGLQGDASAMLEAAEFATALGACVAVQPSSSQQTAAQQALNELGGLIGVTL
jgi:hypothetical protein